MFLDLYTLRTYSELSYKWTPMLQYINYVTLLAVWGGASVTLCKKGYGGSSVCDVTCKNLNKM